MRWPGQLAAGSVNNRFLMTIDLLPTLAGRAGAKLPSLPIDGRDVWPLIAGSPDAVNPHEGYGLWYAQNELQAVVSGDGRWKLMLPHRYRTLGGRPGGTGGRPAHYETIDLKAPELYDLLADPGEATNVAADHPDVVGRLQAFAEKCRADLGDTLSQKPAGAGTRKPGSVANPGKN
jgi:arylsulfatase A-like enzyme